MQDYHLHLEGRYEIRYFLKFVVEEEKRNIKEIGLSEHSFLFKQTRSLYKNNEWLKTRQNIDIQRYFEFVERLRYRGSRVRVGIEVDYIPDQENAIRSFLDNYMWDYVLGSVHWMEDQWIGKWRFDQSTNFQLYKEKNIVEGYKRYYHLLKKAAASRLFDVIAHPDLIKIIGYYPSLTQQKVIEKDFIDELSSKNLCIEINTSGLRKSIKEIYPNFSFLKKCFRANIPIVFGSDAHIPKDAGRDIDIAVKVAQKAGYDCYCVFTNRRRHIIPIKVSDFLINGRK